jgi:putative nucleotidyltransferase with HDIG domain
MVDASPSMRLALKVTIGVTVCAAFAVGLFAVTQWQLDPGIGGPFGLLFWFLVVLVASAVPVRLPSGPLVTVAGAPLLAATVLGGPVAAAVVAALGTTELREIRGLVPWRRSGVPWYGTLYNHASIVIATIAAAFGYLALVGPGFEATPRHLIVVLVVSVIYEVMAYGFTALGIGLRDGLSPVRVFVTSARQSGAGLIGLVPFAWLMAAVYHAIGPIGVLAFFLPLYTTRDGYQKVVEIRDMFTQTVRSLASAVDAKDPYTAGHSVRVQQIARDIGRELHLGDKDLEALEWGGLLHDIGKIGIADSILLKRGPLNARERVAMNTHPVKGEEIIRPVAKLKPELPVIRHHHEWFDGTGYPDGLKGEQIPFLARILGVADSFEAMTSARPYRMTPLTEAHAIEELHRFSGIQFDPQVVVAFERVLARRPEWSRPNEPHQVPARHIPTLGEAEHVASA